MARRPALEKPARPHPAAPLSAVPEVPTSEATSPPPAASSAPAKAAPSAEVRMSVDVRRDHKKRLEQLKVNTDRSIKELVDEAFSDLLDKHGV